MKSLLRTTNFLSKWNQAIRFMSTPTASFKAKDVEIKLCDQSQMRPKPDADNLVFGTEFSDHMLEIEWTADQGWGKPLINQLHNFTLHPAAKVYHYAFELFEGMKAYRGVDQKIRLFRPDLNMKRMLSSSERAALPEFDGGELTELIKKLVSVDREWVPHSTTSTLYVRPTFIGTEPSLGILKTNRALLYVITSPVGCYFSTGFKPVTLLANTRFVRAWEGGSGAYKLGANYAPTIQIQIEAQQRYGCQQVLWLYGPEQNITEVGSMNFFLYWRNEHGEEELITPSLSSGTILPGITRESLLDLARQWGEFKVTERELTMSELVQGLKENRVLELFGAGTACVVCPIEKIVYEGSNLEIPTMNDGAPLTMRLYQELTDIQFGRTSSDWSVLVD